MGFYSFYRIFKDIIKSIFGNKAWRYTLIIALIVIVFTVYSSKVNAEELHDYVVDYYTTFSDTQGDPGYRSTTKYLFIPVFANSSYAISWTSGISINFYFLDSTNYRVNGANVANFPNNYIETQTQGSYGYFAIKDGYLIASYRAYDGYYDSGNPVNPNFHITTDYDFTSNLSTIHNDLLSIIGVEGKGLSKDFISIKGIHATTRTNTFLSDSNFTTIYFKVEDGFTYDINFTQTPQVPETGIIRFGYCSQVPALNVPFDSYNNWDDVNKSNPISITSSSNSYFYVSYLRYRISNISITSHKNMIEAVVNQAQETRETMTDSSISQNSSDYSLPSDSTNDITQDGFTSIFDRIRSTFTTGSSTPAVINIPFTNKSFTISKASVFGSANLGIVQTLIEAFWWFVVSVFIVKDIFKKIEKIKTGNIEFTETTNIKEDIL